MTDHVDSLTPGAPNLDEMSQGDLYTFIAATRGKYPTRAARRLFGQQGGAGLPGTWRDQDRRTI